MNKIIRDQLNRVTTTKIEYNENDTYIFIPKTIRILNSSLEKGRYYIISLFDSILYPSESSTLASNWNKGYIPKHRIYTVEILDNIAGMVHIDGVANDELTDNFYGWLPYDGFEVIKKL